MPINNKLIEGPRFGSRGDEKIIVDKQEEFPAYAYLGINPEIEEDSPVTCHVYRGGTTPVIDNIWRPVGASEIK